MVVKDNNVATANVEARQMLTCVLGIIDIFIDNKSLQSLLARHHFRSVTNRSTRVGLDSDADLANRPIFTEDIIHFF